MVSDSRYDANVSGYLVAMAIYHAIFLTANLSKNVKVLIEHNILFKTISQL